MEHFLIQLNIDIVGVSYLQQMNYLCWGGIFN